MNNDLEELLRDGINRLTSESKLPAGLADRARCRAASRQRSIRAAVAAGTAATAVVAAIAVTGAGSAHAPVAGRAHSTAFVVDRIERAVAATTAAAPVLSVRTIYGPNHSLLPPIGGSPFGPGARSRSERSWTRDEVSRVDAFGNGGKLQDAQRSVTTGHTVKTVVVDYRNRTWWHGPVGRIVGRPSPNGCSSMLGWAGPLPPVASCPAQLEKEIRQAVASGRLKVSGHQRVDGVNAIRLTGELHAQLVEQGHPTVKGTVHETLWVGYRSYLPVRFRANAVFTHLRSQWYQEDFRWLAPTRANLALLRLTIPRGFRHVQQPHPGPAGQ